MADRRNAIGMGSHLPVEDENVAARQPLAPELDAAIALAVDELERALEDEIGMAPLGGEELVVVEAR